MNSDTNTPLIKDFEKEWTILIYANGNNDLEPEMWQAVSNLTKVKLDSDINIVVQIGRADEKLVKLLRKNSFTSSEEKWDGVRRYFIENNKLNLVNDLNKVNMANPKQLYSFIKWGIKEFPAKRYMLILGGHGYQFVGTMTDYTQKAPFIMGIPEMTEAINNASNEAGGKIDLLVLDICFFNFIEVIYEFGKDENHAVQNIITYIFNGPIEGMSYSKIIEILQKNSCNDAIKIIHELLDSLPYDLVAFIINHQLLNNIKQQFSDLAYKYCNNNSEVQMKDLFVSLYSKCNFIYNKKANIPSILIHSNKITQNETPLIGVVNDPTSDLKVIYRYYRLGFAQHNYWTYLISKKTLDMNTAIEKSPPLIPLKLKPKEVYAFISIMNPELEKKEKKEILEKLYKQRKWKR